MGKDLILITGSVMNSNSDSVDTYNKLISMIDVERFDVSSPLDTMQFTGTDSERYERAMRHAACCSLSWTMMYDFACPANEENKLDCPYTEGNVLGVSVIATGHASVDGFACYMWFDLYEVYRLTGCISYKKAAIALQNATKAFTDYYGIRGWRYKCLMVEACQVSDFLFKPTTKDGSVWLPWCAVAQINPITYTFEKYGVYQLEDIVEE